MTSPGLSHFPAAQSWDTLPKAVSESHLPVSLCWHPLASSWCLSLLLPGVAISGAEPLCLPGTPDWSQMLQDELVSCGWPSSPAFPIPKQNTRHLEPFNVWCTLHRSETFSHSWVALFDSNFCNKSRPPQCSQLLLCLKSYCFHVEEWHPHGRVCLQLRRSMATFS